VVKACASKFNQERDPDWNGSEIMCKEELVFVVSKETADRKVKAEMIWKCIQKKPEMKPHSRQQGKSQSELIAWMWT